MKLSLRIRILLFFAAIALGVIAMIAVGLWLARALIVDAAAFDAFIQGAILAVVGVCLLVGVIAYLFDAHVARPIEAIASAMRARVHADVAKAMDAEQARYLGDLAAAACATTAQLVEGRGRWPKASHGKRRAFPPTRTGWSTCWLMCHPPCCSAPGVIGLCSIMAWRNACWLIPGSRSVWIAACSIILMTARCAAPIGSFWRPVRRRLWWNSSARR